MSDDSRSLQTRVDREDKIEFDVAASRRELSEAALLRQLVRDFLDEEREQAENRGRIAAD